MKSQSHLPLFDGCSRRERALIQRLGTSVNVVRGTQLNSQGDRRRQFAVVLDGELKVERDGHELARLCPGDCSGEIGLLSGATVPATATVEAVSDSVVWTLSRSEFDELVNGIPIVAERLTHIALTRAARTHAQSEAAQ